MVDWSHIERQVDLLLDKCTITQITLLSACQKEAEIMKTAAT